MIRDGKEVQFLGGDCVTSQSIQDEQMQLIQTEKLNGNTDYLPDDEQMDGEDIEVERASDDEDDGATTVGNRTRNRNRLRRIADSDYVDDKVEGDDGEDSEAEAPMDDLEPEHLDFEDESAKKKRSTQTSQSFSRRHRTEVDEANLSGDEQEATVFIDNLPNDEQGIRSMLIQVRKTIQEMEKQFLLEEQEDIEEDERLLNSLKEEMSQLTVSKPSDEDQEVAPNYITPKQFWCIPLSVNVMSFEFDKLHEAQMKHGGRLFDVITMDPPW